MKKNVKNAVEGVKKIANTLTGDAREFADAIVGAFEQMEADEQEHNIDELIAEIDRLKEAAQQVATSEEVADRIQQVRNEFAGMLNAGRKIEDKITKEVRLEIANAISTCRNRDEVKNAIEKVLKKNDITGVSAFGVIKSAFEFEHKPVELFDDFGRTQMDVVYLVGIDESNAEQIAKQWTDDPAEIKAVQSLAAEGVKISTKYLYKKQRIANEALDSAREAGTLPEIETEVMSELEQQVKRLAERAALVGDTVNRGSSVVTTFEPIIEVEDSRVTHIRRTNSVLESSGIFYLAETADAVEGAVEEKVAVVDKKYARDLSYFVYGTGGSPAILSDEQIAAMAGVKRLVKVDYLPEGTKAIVLKPSAYKVRIKNENSIPYPNWDNNSLYYMYELNMGGALCQLKSAAVLQQGDEVITGNNTSN